MTFSIKSIEIIFVLGYKVTTVYVGLILVYIGGFRFEDSLNRLFCSLLIDLIITVSQICKGFCFYDYFENLLKIIFDILEDLESNKAKSKIERFGSKGFENSKTYFRIVGSS